MLNKKTESGNLIAVTGQFQILVKPGATALTDEWCAKSEKSLPTWRPLELLPISRNRA
jgi:hypothetical protein